MKPHWRESFEDNLRLNKDDVQAKCPQCESKARLNNDTSLQRYRETTAGQLAALLCDGFQELVAAGVVIHYEITAMWFGDIDAWLFQK